MKSHRNTRVGQIGTWLGLLLGVATVPAQAIDMGDASVQSMQGQRLRLAVPYGSAPGQRVPVMSISVASVEAPPGFTAPSPENFVISKPEHRNVIYLQSKEPVRAPSLKLVLNVADTQPTQVAYEVAVPPMKYAAATHTDAAPSAKNARRGAKRAAAGTRAARPLAANRSAKPSSASPARTGDALFKTR